MTFKIYVIKHKAVKCAYIRVVRPNTKFESRSVVFTPLRNCLTQHLTSNATEERRCIYEWLQLHGLLMVDGSSRGSGWSDAWDCQLTHDDLQSEEETLVLFNKEYTKLVKKGYFMLNSRFMR